MKYFFLFFLIFTTNSIFAQKGTFKGYATAGVNLNQIEGDSVAGFNRWGLVGGVGTYFMLTHKFSAQLELNYSQRGASGVVYNELGEGLYHRSILTNYIEAPFMFNYHDKHIAQFGAGCAFSSLINYSQKYNHQTLEDTVARVQDFYKSLDISLVLSATFNIKRHFGVNLRFMHSIVPINKNNLYGDDQYHSNLSVRGVYKF